MNCGSSGNILEWLKGKQVRFLYNPVAVFCGASFINAIEETWEGEGMCWCISQKTCHNLVMKSADDGINCKSWNTGVFW